MMNWLKSLFSFFNKLRTRPGLEGFLSKWQGAAYSELMALSRINSNEDFHLWRNDAQARLKVLTGEVKDNWIAILLNFAFEEAKARNVIK